MIKPIDSDATVSEVRNTLASLIEYQTDLAAFQSYYVPGRSGRVLAGTTGKEVKLSVRYLLHSPWSKVGGRFNGLAPTVYISVADTNSGSTVTCRSQRNPRFRLWLYVWPIAVLPIWIMALIGRSELVIILGIVTLLLTIISITSFFSEQALKRSLIRTITTSVQNIAPTSHNFR